MAEGVLRGAHGGALVIHAYALEPAVVASWGRREWFRFVHDKFGLGTARAMLELPSFSKWKRAVYDAATREHLSQEDMKRVEELFRLFAGHKCRRADAVYDGLWTWLENAEREYDRKPFAGIIATTNPRAHDAVITGDTLGPGSIRWARPSGVTVERRPEALAAALSAMLANCRVLHLVDPHFGPENSRHRRVLEAFMSVLASNGVIPEVVRVHTLAKSTLEFFEMRARQMAARLPSSISVEFARWQQRDGGDLIHNRYVLTDLGGVSFGVGIDAGREGETDDLQLLAPATYVLRWAQYVQNNGELKAIDAPAAVRGLLGPAAPRERS
jgi:hypothetical protein